jgi:hypothetical protein
LMGMENGFPNAAPNRSVTKISPIPPNVPAFGNQDQPDPTQRTGDGSEECQRERLGEEEPENGSIVHPQQFPDSDLTDSFPDGDQEYAEGPRFSAMPAR